MEAEKICGSPERKDRASARFWLEERHGEAQGFGIAGAAVELLLWRRIRHAAAFVLNWRKLLVLPL